MFAVLSAQTTITSETGPDLTAHRRTSYFRSMLALLAAFLALPVFGTLAVMITVWIDSQPPLRAGSAVLSGVMALLVVAGIVGTYLLLNPRWHVEFRETSDSEAILHLTHQAGHWPLRTRYIVTSADGETLGHLDQTWSLFRRTWNVCDQQGVVVAQARERASHYADVMQYLLRPRRRFLTHRPPVTFDLLEATASASDPDTIGEYEGRQNIDGTLIVTRLPPTVDPRLLVAFGMLAFLTQPARGS